MSMNMDRLVEIMELLRDPDKGCPWDVEQTFETIAPHTIEEAYEVAEAIQRKDMGVLVDELGDLLLQVVFHAQIARESSLFDMEDVAGAICDKLVRRHPHVFADANVDSAAAQLKAWEDTKAGERRSKAVNGSNGEGNNNENNEPHSVLDDVAMALPALTRALKLQKRAARVGFDWDEAATVLDKVEEEIIEIKEEIEAGSEHDRLEDEVGDLLFTIVNLARKLGLDAEKSLRRANAKFERRFRGMEAMLAAENRSPDNAGLDEMETLWERAKGMEDSGEDSGGNP